MSVVLSPNLVIGRADDYVDDLPVILWQNLVDTSNLVADHEDTDYPATNLANPRTAELWKSGSTSDGSLTVTLSGEIETDSVGIARHNFGSGEVTVTIYGTLSGGSPAIVAGPTLLGDDTPALWVFEPDYYTEIEVLLEPGSVQPQAGVLYVGPSLTVMRNVPPGYRPIKHARERDKLIGSSSNGEYIGAIILSERLATTFDLRLLDGDWYWENMQDFVDASTEPFFLAQFPDSDPTDCAFCWALNDPQPTISQITGEVDISFQLGGLGL